MKGQILPRNSEAWERITLHSSTIFHVFLLTFQLLSERVLIFTFYYIFFQSLTVRDVKPKILGMRKCEELENLFSKTRWKLTSAGFQGRNSLQANSLPEREDTVFCFCQNLNSSLSLKMTRYHWRLTCEQGSGPSISKEKCFT